MTLWDWFNNNSGVMTALATVGLAVVTGCYLIELRRQRKEMQTPVIEITPTKQGKFFSVAITNNGPGVALNIKGNIYQKELPQELYKDLRGRPLQSGKGFKYKIDAGSDMNEILVKVSFKDVFGNTKEIIREIKVSDLQEWDKREIDLFEHFYGIN